MSNDKKHPFHTFCEIQKISQDDEDEFIQFFRRFLDRYFIIKNDYLYAAITDNIPIEDVEHYWDLFLKEKERGGKFDSSAISEHKK